MHSSSSGGYRQSLRRASMSSRWEVTALSEQPRVDTQGGAYFAGSVSANRDVIGGNKIVGGDEISGDIGTNAADLATLFDRVYRQIDAPSAERKANADEIRETVQRVQTEAGKGDQADASRIDRWLGTLGDVAPDVLEVLVDAFANP